MTAPITIEHVDALALTLTDQSWPFAAERRADIDANWARLTAAKPAMFNGPVLLMRVKGIDTASDGRRTFRAAFFHADFKTLMGFRDLGFPDQSVRNGFAMAALRAADGAFLAGEMGAHTAIAGRVQFAAGTPDPSDIRGDAVDLEASAVRELAEEMGLTPPLVTVTPGWSIVTEGSRMAFMKDMCVNLTADAALARIRKFLSADPEPELSRVLALRSQRDLEGLSLSGFMRAYLQSRWGGPGGVLLGHTDTSLTNPTPRVPGMRIER